MLVPATLPALYCAICGLGLSLADEQVEGRYARWSGDGLELRRGEILIFEAGG